MSGSGGYAEADELLKDFMVKRTVVKGHKVFSIDSAKSRWFILTREAMLYREGSLEKGPGKVKGMLPLPSIRLVDVVDLSRIDKNMRYGFQVQYEGEGLGLKTLYVNAQSTEMRDKWIDRLKSVCAQGGVNLSTRYHPNVWTSKDSCYTCCGQPSKEAPPCRESTTQIKLSSNQSGQSYGSASGNRSVSPSEANHTGSLNRSSPLPPRPARADPDVRTTNDLIAFSPTKENPPPQQQAPPLQQAPQPERKPPIVGTVRPQVRKAKKVKAVYEFVSTQPEDLDMSKGDILDVLDDETEAHWYKARNQYGKEGFIPSNYVEDYVPSADTSTPKQAFKGPEGYPWYYEVSRSSAEMMLKGDGREGCYLVRKSEQKNNSYTLGVLCKEGAGIRRDESGSVSHYHIRRNEQGLYFLSERHPAASIPELISYHSQNCAGLITRLRFYLHEAPAPPTVGLAHGQYLIKFEDLRLLNKLGSGQFGEVWRATYKGTRDVAVKKTLKGALNDHEFVDEARTMMALQHPGLVQLYGICESPDFLIVTEFMEGGSLLDYLKKKGKSLLPQTNILLDMAIQVVKAMAYLESQSVIHRDLAARNCLVRQPVTVKVADFGLARHVVDDEYTSSYGAKFPIRWSSPEILQYNKFSSKSDVWAFGVLMWEIFTAGELPYRHIRNNQDVTNYIATQQQHLPRPSDCPADVYAKIMEPCWMFNDENRPSFSALIGIINDVRSHYGGEVYASSGPASRSRRYDQ